MFWLILIFIVNRNNVNLDEIKKILETNVSLFKFIYEMKFLFFIRFYFIIALFNIYYCF